MRSLAIYVRNSIGDVVAGIVGGTYKGIARVHMTWFFDDKLRSELGGQVVAAFEEESKVRACTFCLAEESIGKNICLYEQVGYARMAGLPGFTEKIEPVALIKYFESDLKLPGNASEDVGDIMGANR